MSEPELLQSGINASYITVIIIVVSIVSWLVNYVKEQQKPQRRPQRPAPQQPPRAQQRRVPPQQQLQNEIDLFLQKTGGRQQAAEPIIEIVPEDEFEDASWHQALADEPAHTLGSKLENRHLTEKKLGSGIQQHVNSHAGSNELDFIVDRHMDDRVDSSVFSHLGSFSGDAVPAKSARSETAEQIFRLLQTPQGVRQAIVLKEILTRKEFS